MCGEGMGCVHGVEGALGALLQSAVVMCADAKVRSSGGWTGGWGGEGLADEVCFGTAAVYFDA